MNKEQNLNSPQSQQLNIAGVNKRALLPEVLFESFLKNNLEKGNEFRMVVTKTEEGTIEFYCHPLGRDGSTFDGYVMNTSIYPKKAIDNLIKHLHNDADK